jgi:hypothetical protein
MDIENQEIIVAETDIFVVENPKLVINTRKIYVETTLNATNPSAVENSIIIQRRYHTWHSCIVIFLCMLSGPSVVLLLIFVCRIL